jgi:hypothetical protein
MFDPVTGDFRTFTSPLVGGQFIVPLGANGLPLTNSLGNGNLGKIRDVQSTVWPTQTSKEI